MMKKKALSDAQKILNIVLSPFRRKKYPKTMKHIAFVTLVAVAFGLGACAKESKPSASSAPMSKNVKGFKK